MTKIISNDEIKVILGISGSSQDALVEIWNKTATEMLEDFLQVQSLLVHTVTEERVEIVNQYKIILNDFPVDLSETITVKDNLNTTITGLSYTKDPGYLRTLNVENSDGLRQWVGRDEVLVSYTAGYTAQGTILVNLNSGLAEKTITVVEAGTVTEYTFKASGASGNEIDVGGDTDETATNIATALGGTSSGSTVTLPESMTVSLGTATAAQLTITNFTIPQSLQMAVALLAGGGLVEPQKKGGISSYTIGGKTVNFRSEAELNAFKQIVSKYGGSYRKASVKSI